MQLDRSELQYRQGGSNEYRQGGSNEYLQI